MKLLDPKNDYVFKRLFADAPDLLAELINAIRRDCPPITELQVLNPTIVPGELTGKYIVLDILAADIRGSEHDVEGPTVSTAEATVGCVLARAQDTGQAVCCLGCPQCLLPGQNAEPATGTG